MKVGFLWCAGEWHQHFRKKENSDNEECNGTPFSQQREVEKG